MQVTAKARLDEHPKCNSIRLGTLEQDLTVRELHITAGIALQRCGIDGIKAFQTVLNGYQIHVLSKEHFNAVIYKGPNAEKKIYLYYHDGHFDVITKMTAFLGRNYHCTDCEKGYDHKENHSCYNVCHHCFKIHDFQEILRTVIDILKMELVLACISNVVPLINLHATLIKDVRISTNR